MRVDEALVAEFTRQGVRQVFGLMGEDTAKLLLLLPGAGISYLSSRHESGSVGMADGYSRASGDVGVAVLSRGPGLTNGLTAITTAARCGSRVLVIAADTSSVVPRSPSVAATARLSHKYVNQAAALDAVGVAQVTLDDPAGAAADLAAVFARVRSGLTTVVNVPMDILAAAYDEAAGSSVAPVAARRSPDPVEIGNAADLLETTWAATHPVIVAGRGAVRSGAAPALRRLGEITGALMATTVPAWGMFDGDPFDAGVMGTFSSSASSELFARADVLLAFGASLNRLTTYGNSLCPKARIIHFDDDQEAFGKHVQAELVVHGDAGLAVTALVEELERRGHHHDGYRTEAVAEKIATFDPRAEVRDQSDEEGLDPRILSIALEDAIPAERNLVVDAGHYMALLLPYMRISSPEALILPLDFGAIGSAAPLATGAALARRDRLTVLAAGDGGFMMILAELDTAVRAHVPLLVLVYDDSAYGAEVQILASIGMPTAMARFEERSFDAIARAMGAEGMAVRTLDDVAALKARLVRPLDGVLLVDCRITTAVRADFMNAVALVTGQAVK